MSSPSLSSTEPIYENILFFSANKNHLEWIKKMPNALYTNQSQFYNEYINIKFYPKLIIGSNLSGIESPILKDYKKVDYKQETKKFMNSIENEIFNELSEIDKVNNKEDFVKSIDISAHSYLPEILYFQDNLLL